MANNKEQERITYIRQNINPTYKLSQADALTYAAKMGALDSYHGISQFIGDTFGIDDAVEELKTKDRTLQAILESEEYGGKAMGAFLASAVVADPIGWLPIVGWVQKGKKAKTLYDFTKYGAIAGGFHGSVGYVSEESPGLIGDKQSRIENMAIGSGAGTILGALGGVGLNAIRKYKGRKSATKTDEVEVLEPPSDKPVKEAKFVRNEDGTYWAHGKSNQYQRTTYQINKNKNGTWTVNKVDEKRPPTEYLVPTELSKFEPNIQKIAVVKTLKQAKQIVNGKVAPKSKLDVKAKIQEEQTKQPTVDPKKIADEVSAERITKEIVDEAEGKPSYKDTVLKQYQDMFGHAIKQKVFDNWGTSLMGVGGGISGYHLDPDATFMEKMGTAMLVGASLATVTRFAGKIKYGDEVLGDAISRQIVDLYGLSDDYKALRKNLQVNKNKIGNRFLEIAKEASEKLEKDELKLLYNFMTGNAKGIDNLSEEAIKIGKEGRELITEMGQKYVDLGLLNPETFKKNVATYLHRTYTKHLNFPEKGIKVDKENAKNFMGAIKEFTIIGDNLKSRGIHRNYAKKSWQKKKSKLVKEGWYIEKEAKGRVHIRRDFTKEEREVRGEIEDAAFAIAETGRLMSNDLSIAKFFDDIATAVDDEGNKLYALTKDEWEAFGNPADFIQLSNKTIRGTKQKAFGTLAGDEKAMSPQQYRKQRKTLEAQGYKVVGKNKKSVYLAKEAMYVHKDVEKDIRRMIPLSNENKIAEDIEKSFTGLQTLWKLSKTAWNPAVHVNNVMSNMLLLDFADTGYKYLSKAVKEFRLGAKGKSEVYRLAKEQGVFDSDLVTKELRSHLGTSVDQALHKITSADAPGDFFGYGAKLYKAMRNVKQATLGKLEDAYQFEDQIFRMAVFMDRLDKKNNISTAASEARKWFIDYDISAPWVNTLRRTATPFLSYTYRVVPLLAEAAILRPHKFAKWSLVAAGINAASNKLTNDGEEVERITMREELNKTLWDIPGMPPTMLKLPWKSNEGDSQYLDISRWSPGGDIFESREEGVPFLPTPLQPSFGIYGDFYNTVVARKDTFTGQEIENLGLGTWEDSKTLTKALGKKLIPNVPIIPGSFAYKKIQKALRQEAPNEHALFEKTIRKFYNAEEQQLEGSPYSGKYSPLEAFLYSLGVKLRPQSIEANRNLKDFEYNTKLNDAHKVVTKAEKEYANGTISYEEKEALIKESEARVLELVAHYDKYSDKFDEASIDREERRQSNVTGGLIEGEGEVPYTKENPADRINPFTGEPYQQMDRLGFYEGTVGSGTTATGVYRWGANKLGITGPDIERIDQEAARLVNKAIDNGLVREGDRIPTKKDGTYNLSKVGDAYDVIHHAVLGYKFGDTTIRRAALQGKEYIQAIGKPKAAEIDRLNNAAAFNLRKNTKENQTLEELIFKKIAERNRKLKSNTPLVKGKDFFFNTEDVQMERSGYNEGGSDDKKVSDMERLGFVKERNIADGYRNSKHFQKIQETDPEHAAFLLKRAENAGTVIDTMYVDHQNSKLKVTPETNKMITIAQNNLENLGDIFSDRRKDKTIRWMRNEKNKINKEFKEKGFDSEYLKKKELTTEESIQNRINTLDKNMILIDYQNSRNPNKFNTPIMTSGGWMNPDKKGDMHEKYLAKYKKWEEGDRTKPEPPKDAGLDSFHLLGKAIDLNRDYYDALGLMGDGQGKLFNESEVPEFMAVKEALISAGFVQNPKEWWHFSHGEFDQ